jgi:hypothetical protein
MAKTREKVQQHGFWDQEVSLHKHDEICIWAFEHALDIFKAVCSKDFDRDWVKIDLLEEFRNDQNALAIAREFQKKNPRPLPRIKAKKLEYVLHSYSGYQNSVSKLVGYADLVIETEMPCLKEIIDYSSAPYGRSELKELKLQWSKGPSILVEAKSIMPTLGELMRQINLYRTAFFGEVVVVSPDDQFQSILAEQNVSFVLYAPVKSNAG